MQLRWPGRDKMWLGILLALLFCSSLEGQENSFTINSISMRSLPEWTVGNGHNLTLQCLVDISTTSDVRPQILMHFYKDDVMFYNISTTGSIESYFIPKVRVYDSGKYKCTAILNNKKKTTQEYEVWVKGVPSPRVELDKTEVIQGGLVTVNCSVEEEKGPITFKIEKFSVETQSSKGVRRKLVQNQNFAEISFPIEEQDRILVFYCQAWIMSGLKLEKSDSVRSDIVTVRESFSLPKFHISPVGMITEGDQLHIKCTIQVTHLAQTYPEIIIQKDREIVANTRDRTEATYSVMALVDHNGNYTCKAEDSGISKVSSIVVNITELFSKPNLEASATLLDRGKTISLWCTIPGAPPADFTIQKGNTIVAQAPNFTTVASERDSGAYFCTAAMGNVVKRSNKVNVTVCEMLSTPLIFREVRTEVIKGQTIAISCQSRNGTSPISYRLLKAKEVSGSFQVNSNDPVLFHDTPTEDTEYQCIADNCHSHGEMISEILKVKVIAPVDEVQLSILYGRDVETGNDIVLQCSVKEGSGPITYKFYRENDGKPFYSTVSNETKAIWYKTQVSKEQEGEYYCTANNRANAPRSSAPHSNTLPVRVFLAPWKKGLIAVVVIGLIIATLILGARCYFLKKAKAKQIPVEMSRPAAPLLNSNNEKISSDPSTEANSHYGYNDDAGNHSMKSLSENKDSLNSNVEYTEVEVSLPETHQALETKGTETVYSEIRKTDPDRTNRPRISAAAPGCAGRGWIGQAWRATCSAPTALWLVAAAAGAGRFRRRGGAACARGRAGRRRDGCPSRSRSRSRGGRETRAPAQYDEAASRSGVSATRGGGGSRSAGLVGAVAPRGV
ncbi:PREDICTED: platelet endothelial cell adhesion molecule [Elephantulus edwardii]|uniref:platelet endothelial cell adhesion molecule n=1 Tax=Elephantulus edwardii TaxID=28737 RepID=UPI0003F0CB46|nr:PREDICTED: platelet endothelial cell adhesion molecule [Elephantulus edwardii]